MVSLVKIWRKHFFEKKKNSEIKSQVLKKNIEKKNHEILYLQMQVWTHFKAHFMGFKIILTQELFNKQEQNATFWKEVNSAPSKAQSSDVNLVTS